MEMEGLKENRQDEKGKVEMLKTCPNSSKLAQSRGTRPGLAQGSPRRVHSIEVGLFLVKHA